MTRRTGYLLPLLAAALAHCGTDPMPTNDAAADAVTDASTAPDATPRNILENVPAQENWDLPGLTAEAEVIRTPGGVPHIYAANRIDLARVQGFVIARDRFFMIDLERRFSQSKLSELLGDAAIHIDQENRGVAMSFVLERILAGLTEEQGRILDAFAEGVNAYIAAVRDGSLEPPSEFRLAAPLLGSTRVADIMQPFARRDMAAILATLVYNLGFETGDADRGRSFANLPGTRWAGTALGDLRRDGVMADIWNRIAQIAPINSAAGMGLETDGSASMIGSANREATPRRAPRDTQRPASTRLPNDMMERLNGHLRGMRTRLHGDEGFGSNSWAVGRMGTPDGGGILAGDGHLPLTVPSLFYQIGLDTSVLGAGPVHQVGLTIPGFPMMAVGTNGNVAWCQTQLGNDITDWYREEITLDMQGAPLASRFRGESRPLMRFAESFVVADVPALMSRGRTETWNRYTTFDGRWITAIEGRTVARDYMAQPGETVVELLGDFVVPGDADGDGTITAVSFDYTGLDGGNLVNVLDGFGLARDVNEFRAATRGLNAYSQNIIAADSHGSVFYTSYQAQPCRGYLARNPDGTWATGSDPTKILDGTRYGGFRIPFTGLVVDESMGMADPYACVVPFDRIPQALDPARGYVLTANNDPGGMSEDNSLTNDPYYVGGPWNDGFRAFRIDQMLRAATTAHQADVEHMATAQADVDSQLARRLIPVLLEAISKARTASAGMPAAGTSAARLAGRYAAAQRDYDEVSRRLTAWAMDPRARSGVETFYSRPEAGDREAAVAAMIFNSWMGRFINGVFDDEPFPAGVFDNGGPSKQRTLFLMLNGRGPGNTNRLASYNPVTQESAYFDVVGTEAVETSDEVALSALDAALTFLRAPPTSANTGGFGTNDMDQWLWGLRHTMRFDSLLKSFLGNNMALAPLADGFSITPRLLPLMPMLPASDPRATLTGFPRHGDQWNVDAANSGFSGTNFTYGSGPNFRMVFALHDGAVRGVNVIPGGQSGLTSSENFSDQASLWLGNRTLPVQFTPAEVVAAATSREHFRPMR